MYNRAKSTFWNRPQPDSNCGSFALGVEEWFYPYNCEGDELEESRDRIIDYMSELGCTREEIMEALLIADTEVILQECPWVEQISLEEAEDSDRVVAYRVYYNEYDPDDTDFHFRVRINGFWFEKCGEHPIRFCGTFADEEPWLGQADILYDSEVCYFRFKKEESK